LTSDEWNALVAWAKAAQTAGLSSAEITTAISAALAAYTDTASLNVMLADYALEAELGDLATLDTVANAQVAANAAIALSKLAALTASRALVSDGSGVVSASAVTATELGYLAGVTSGIQAQIAALVADLAALGDLAGLDEIADAQVAANAAIAWSKLSKAGSSLADLATRAISDTTGTLAVARGGTGATTEAAARTALGLVIGTDVQAHSARLTEVATIGTALQVPRVNAGGTAIEYHTPSAGGSVAGSDTQVQFNDGGAFGGDAGLTYNKTADILSVAGAYYAPNGASSTPSFSFTNATAYGLYYASNRLHLSANGVAVAIGSAFVKTKAANQYQWSGSSDPTGSADTGMGRSAAGVGIVTDGSTGIGAMLAKNPQAAKTANYTVLVTDSNTSFRNTGAAGAVALSLPTPVEGTIFRAYVTAAQTFGFTATSSATIRDGATVSAANGTITSNTVGDYVELEAISTTAWMVVRKGGASGGTWTTT
jgi:hypothetical protein